MNFVKPELLYGYDQLEPYIDTQTMELHHKTHHTAYVNGLANLSENFPLPKNNSNLHAMLEALSINGGIDEADRNVLRDMGGGHYNHSLFWQYMGPRSSEGDMSELLCARIKKDFSSLEKFKEVFNENSKKVFGSGWCWWIYDAEENKSKIVTTANQNNPIMDNPKVVCLLGLDVWEHAYYVKYHSKRIDYITNWWNVVNWQVVSKIHDEIAVTGKRLVLSENGYIKFD